MILRVIFLSNDRLDFFHEGHNQQVSTCRKSNHRALFDKASTETIRSDLGTEVIIEDCRRLGKFFPGKSRTVLVTFRNNWDGRKFRGKVIGQHLYRHKGVMIVPEFSYEDRQVEKKILKKRFELIIQGTEKSRIRIRDLKLYVDGQFVASDSLQLSIIGLNCRSLDSINKRFQLTNFLSNYMSDIACLSESWLDKDLCDNISLNTHYITEARADRENGTHGGVVIFVQKSSALRNYFIILRIRMCNQYMSQLRDNFHYLYIQPNKNEPIQSKLEYNNRTILLLLKT